MLVLDAIAEAQPGPALARTARSLWPGYRAWFVRDGMADRPSFLESRKMLRSCMPELVSTWEALVDLLGGDDIAARFCAMWCPPPYIRGCSQVILPTTPPTLARNYDYAPRLWDAALWRTEWTGAPVMAMTDSLWGVLDGVNASGLAVSLAFGGRRVVGRGFGMPLILRYVLEVCESTRQAVEVLTRTPTHMAYNIAVVDTSGAWATVQTAPDRPAVVSKERASTNHQAFADWPRYEELTESRRRLATLDALLGDLRSDIVEKMLAAPLHRGDHRGGMGTLYTAHWSPTERTVRLAWPGLQVEQSIEGFVPGSVETRVPNPEDLR